MDECKDVFLVKKTTAKPSRKALMKASSTDRKDLEDFWRTNHSVVFVAAGISYQIFVALTKAASRASEVISLCCIGFLCRCDL